MQILCKREQMIYPAVCSHPALHRLSETDQRRFTIPKLFFYKQGPASSEALKGSLSKTLAIFYPLAGRLVERSAQRAGSEGEVMGLDDAAIDGRMDVSCLDQGALFREAWTDTRLDAYMPDFQPHPDFQLLVVPDHDDVLLRVQVTYFSCGGICLCVQAHHGLVDGTSSAHFLECWVQITNGKESVMNFPYILHPRLEVMYRPKEPSSSHMEDFSMDYQDQANIKIHDDTQVVINKIFHFTPNFIDTLKRETSVDGYKHSSFECIMAYMWRNMIIAQGIASSEEANLYYVVNGRRMLEPSLPYSYFGNAILRTHATLKLSGLVDKPLSHITQIIRKSTSMINDGNIRSVLEWQAKRKTPVTSLHKLMSPDFCITSWTTFPLCDLDFGWGNPTCCRVTHMPLNFGIMFPSSQGKRHIDVLVALGEKHMLRFETLISQRILE